MAVSKEKLSKVLQFDENTNKPKEVKSLIDFDVFNSELKLEEGYSVILSFHNDYFIHKSILDFLDHLGFQAKEKGYHYIVYIITDCINELKVPKNMIDVYRKCGNHFGMPYKSVEISIINTIRNAALTGKLAKMNDYFRCELIINNNISSANFISFVSNRFIMLRNYNMELEIND